MKIYEGKTYKARVVNSLTPFNQENLMASLKELSGKKINKMNPSQRNDDMETEGSFGELVAQKLCAKMNDVIYSIDDHGFEKETYQEALEENLEDLRDRYKVYSFGRNW